MRVSTYVSHSAYKLSAEHPQKWKPFPPFICISKAAGEDTNTSGSSKRTPDNSGRYESFKVQLTSVKTVALDWTGGQLSSFHRL